MILTHLLAFAVIGPDHLATCWPEASTLQLSDAGALVTGGPSARHSPPGLRVRAANAVLPIRRS
jgi:hypothetical protein